MTGTRPAPRPQLDLVFGHGSGGTALERRLFRWPFVLTRTFALDSTPAGMLTVILQTSSGAVHGEDRLSQSFHVRPGAAAHVTTQGATVIHRAAAGQRAEETVTIRVEDGGCLEYLPEARILFPDAALTQRVAIDCAPGGIALVSDAFTLHDPTGQRRRFRRLASSLILRCGEQEPVFVDRIDIDSLGRGRTAQCAAFGSVLLAAPGRALDVEALADALSGRLAAIPGLYGAASPLPGSSVGIGVRLAAHELRAVTAGIEAAWIACRERLFGAPPPTRRKGNDAAVPV